MKNPQKCEIWLVDFNPVIGAEIDKIRPGVVVSSNSIGKLPLRIVVPVTSWQDKFASSPWLIKIESNRNNGLSNDSTADTFQVKSVSNKRFVKRLGSISYKKMSEIKFGINICLG